MALQILSNLLHLCLFFPLLPKCFVGHYGKRGIAIPSDMLIICLVSNNACQTHDCFAHSRGISQMATKWFTPG